MNKSLQKELSWLALGTGLVCWAMGQRRVGGSLGALAAGLAALPIKRYDYRDRSVVITGGSRGLGLALARELVAAGAKVTLLARDAAELERARVALDGGDRVHVVACDVTENDQVVHAIADVIARFDGIDAWINNAGAITVGPFESMGERDFEAQLNLHVRAVIGITQLLVPYFRGRGGGRLINISSIGGVMGVPHMAAYATSKHALAGFSTSIAPELAKDNITCTTVYPGLMRTGSPIQAVFKGDHAREFAWFAASDVMPGLSIPADVAARRILKAAAEGRSEVTVGAAAQVARAARGAFPETYALALRTAARVLPDQQSFVRRTGADIRALAQHVEPLREIATFLEARWNQRERTNAEYTLGQS